MLTYNLSKHAIDILLLQFRHHKRNVNIGVLQPPSINQFKVHESFSHAQGEVLHNYDLEPVPTSSWNHQLGKKENPPKLILDKQPSRWGKKIISCSRIIWDISIKQVKNT